MTAPSELGEIGGTVEQQNALDLEAIVQQVKAPQSAWTKLGRMANVLRYYRFSQLLRRGVRTLQPAGISPQPSRLRESETFAVREPARLAFLAIARTRTSRSQLSPGAQRDDLAQGSFTLLGEKRNLGTPIDWMSREKGHPARLWGFQLHYHETLLDLAASVAGGDTDAWLLIWETVAGWIKGNRPEHVGNSDAWHAYCISRRLPIWAQLFALCKPPKDLEPQFLRSFATQAEWLSHALEFDLGGNHLLENLRALALAGCFLEEVPGHGGRAERWLDLAEKYFKTELALQVLPSGEHFERAPMYHCQVLGNLLQVGIVARGIRPQLSDVCLSTAARMGDFVAQILHPDGEIPLWGDSCFGEAYSMDEILALEQVAGMTIAQQAHRGATITGNYWTWREGRDAVLFDAGPVGGDSLPAHAHCDLLGLEASVNGERWFVDSGVYDYEESSMRDYCRSSVAHNVVTVDNQNCCDVWSRFRMGRRGRVTRFEQGHEGGFSWCYASHDGYRHWGVAELARLMVAHQGGAWSCVEAAYLSHSARASELPELVGRLHLAPHMQVESSGPRQLKLTLQDSQRWLTFTEGTLLGWAKGWYCDRFGSRTRTSVITYRPTVGESGNFRFGWWLSPRTEANSELVFAEPAREKVRFAIGDDVFEWEFLEERR